MFCSAKRSPAATPPPDACDAKMRVSRPAKRSPPGAPNNPRSLKPPRTHYRPWNGSTGTKTSPSPAPQAPGNRTSSKPWPTRRSRKTCEFCWFTLESLTATIGRTKVDATTARTISKICGCDLIVVDDIGMLPAGQDAAEAFYRVIDAAYERHSIAVTSNIHPSGFDSIMPKTLATATVDRLLHHAHLITTKGDSHRLAEALAGKGVMPFDLNTHPEKRCPSVRNLNVRHPGGQLSAHTEFETSVDGGRRASVSSPCNRVSCSTCRSRSARASLA